MELIVIGLGTVVLMFTISRIFRKRKAQAIYSMRKGNAISPIIHNGTWNSVPPNTKKCFGCGGSGYVNDSTACMQCGGSGRTVCMSCGGSGRKMQTAYKFGKTVMESAICTACGGGGRSGCRICGGSGRSALRKKCTHCKGRGYQAT